LVRARAEFARPAHLGLLALLLDCWSGAALSRAARAAL
jgi:hypothetical protein